MIRGMETTVLTAEEPAQSYAMDVKLPVAKTNPSRRNFVGKPGPGRPKGIPNKITQTLRQAVEKAAQDCHPQGLAGWLVDRANGTIGDRQIFAGVVSKVIPMQVDATLNGGISINLGWLGARGIGTSAAQAQVIDAQVIDSIEHSSPTRWTTDATPSPDEGSGGQSGGA